jgi:hypothetical protein
MPGWARQVGRLGFTFEFAIINKRSIPIFQSQSPSPQMNNAITQHELYIIDETCQMVNSKDRVDFHDCLESGGFLTGCWYKLRFERIDTSPKQTIQCAGLCSQFSPDSIIYFGEVPTGSEQSLGRRSGEPGLDCWYCETYATVKALKSCNLLRSVRVSTISFIKSCFSHLDAIYWFET